MSAVPYVPSLLRDSPLLPFVVGISAVVAYGFVLQALRIHVHGSRGVSLTAWIIMVFVLPLWFAYGLRMDDAGVSISNAMLILPAVLVVVVWGRDRGATLLHPAVVVPAVAIIALVGSRVPMALLGTVAIVMDIGTTWPQAVSAARSSDVSGVSTSSWVLRSIAMSVWTVYAVTNELGFYTVAAAGKLVACLSVLTVLVAKRH